ncbi:MAG TPA: hypothetical protein VKF17_00385 [Isosphaeraceae bacterium]|nr:hypothetical protein [Isosphaeraceae bacterium]
MPSHFAQLNLGLTAADLDQAWKDRLDDAEALDAAGRHGAAIAARLYAIDIYLKYRICQRLNLVNPLKRLEIHDLDALVVFPGFSQVLAAMPAGSNLKQNWDQIVTFSDDLNDLRYRPAARWSQQQSKDLSRWLDDPLDGVMTWLKNQK